MKIDIEAMFSISEANNNFSQIRRAADRLQKAVIFKNSKPCYLVLNLSRLNNKGKTRVADLIYDDNLTEPGAEFTFSLVEANRNFLSLSRAVDDYGRAIITRHGTPC